MLSLWMHLSTRKLAEHKTFYNALHKEIHLVVFSSWRAGGGYSPIKMTRVLVVPFRGYNVSLCTTYGAIIIVK